MHFCKWQPYFMSKKLSRARGSGGLFLLLPEYTFHSTVNWKEDIKGPSVLSLLPSGQNFHPTNWGWIKEEIPHLSAAFAWKRISAWNGKNGGILLSLSPPAPNWGPVALPWKWGEEETHAFGFTNPKKSFLYAKLGSQGGKEQVLTQMPFVVKLLCHVWLFVTPWTAALQVSMSFTISQSLLRLMSVESMMLPDHVLCHSFPLLPQSFPASGFSPMSWHFSLVDQRCGASASALVLPTTI